MPDHPGLHQSFVRDFEDHIPRITPVSVTIEYGKPIYPKELSKEEQKFIGKYVRELMVETLKKNE